MLKIARMAEHTSDAGKPVGDNRIRNAVLWIGAVSIVSAIAAVAVVRTTIGRIPPDPTSDRIQALIDEANHLLKSLDTHGHG